MDPLMVPIIQEKLLGTLAVKATLGLVPLQVIAVGALVTTGLGFTVTVMVKGAPGQVPIVAVGVTIYCTDPEVVLLGLVKT